MSSVAVRSEGSAPETSERLVAFINPYSPNAAAVRAALLESGRFLIHDLDPATIREQIGAAVRGGARRIVVAGGDGTLGTAVSAVLGSNAELAVIPAGTLNHFARDHGIPGDPAEAVPVAFGDTVQRIDVGLVSRHVFLNTASVGLYTNYVRSRERLERRLGYRAASAAAFVSTFVRPRLLSVELQIDGVTSRYRTPLLFVGVGERELKAPKFGGRVEGGRRGLHVMVVHGRSPLRLLALAARAATRGAEHLGDIEGFDSFVVDSCIVRVRRRRIVTLGLDGELLRVPAPLEFAIQHDAVRIVAPSRPADEPPAA